MEQLNFYDKQLAVFIERPNRFIAIVDICGISEKAHVPNTGRMGELFIPGTKVLLTPGLGKNRKTKWDLRMVETTSGWMFTDSHIPNRLVYNGLKTGYFPWAKDVVNLKAEYTYNSSRFDFRFEKNNEIYLVEVKCCTLIENNTAKFPDAPTLRGRRHVLHLAKAVDEGYKSKVVFIIGCSWAENFMPNTDNDPDFAKALRFASSKGVDIMAYTCRTSIEGVSLLEKVPVFL